MPRLSFARATLCAGLLISTACGSSSTSPGVDEDDPGMSATIGGVAWQSAPPEASARAVMSGTRYTIEIEAIGIDTPWHLELTLGGITEPGTYPIGVDALTMDGGALSLRPSGESSTWTTMSPGTGTVTVTSIGSNGIAGTFAAEAVATFGNAVGTRSVIDGRFNLPFSQYVPSSEPAWEGGNGTLVFDGTTEFVRTGFAVVSTTGDDVGISLSTTTLYITVFFDGLPEPGTYDLKALGLSPSILASRPDGTGSWSTIGGDDAGTIIITQSGPDRIAGRFVNVTLVGSSSALEPIILSGGEFDVGIR